DVPTLKNVRLSLQTLDLLSFPVDRIKFVLNRANSKVGLKPKEVEAALRTKVDFEIPSERVVPLTVNRGNPAVLAQPSADFSDAGLRAVTVELALERTPLTREARRRVVREIADDILGYGPLEPLLRDDSVTEVMVNCFEKVYTERAGKIERSQVRFVDDAHVM